MINKYLTKQLAMHAFAFLALLGFFGVVALVSPVMGQTTYDPATDGRQANLGFSVPNFTQILTFFIRAFFLIAGLAALFFLLLGAFGWITSGGDKDAITAARDKIQAAVIGLILIVAVLAIIVTLEQLVFQKAICLGISCPVIFPQLIPASG